MAVNVGKQMASVPVPIEQEKKLVDSTVKDLVLGMLAVGQNAKQIVSMVKRCAKISISERMIYYYKQNHQDTIAKIRDEYVKNLVNLVPIANIVNRALIRQRLVDDLLKPSKLWRRIPKFYKGGICGYVREGSHEAINTLLDSQAQEISSIQDQAERRKLFEILKHSGNKAINFIIYGEALKGD